jgi:hypothetical protein
VQLEDAPLAGNRAQVILKPLLLRRTKDSTLEGKPILSLPRKDIELVKLQFSEEEREVGSFCRHCAYRRLTPCSSCTSRMKSGRRSA